MGFLYVSSGRASETHAWPLRVVFQATVSDAGTARDRSWVIGWILITLGYVETTGRGDS